WTDVGVTLVSGRPISFKMDLYQPLYVPRPEERLELLAGLRSVMHDRGRNEATFVYATNQDIIGGPAATPPRAADPLPPASSAPPGAASAAPLGAAYAGLRAQATTATGFNFRPEQNQQMNLGASVTAAAKAAKLGDFFQYAIDRPVSLARQ